MPLNWFLEYLKWKLILKVGEINAKNLKFKSFLSGVAISTITPNRIGNFIGRMIWFPKRTRAYISFATLYGNFSQFIATILFGLMAYFISFSLPQELKPSSGLLLSIVLLLIVALLFYHLSYRLAPLLFTKYTTFLSNLKLKLKKISLMLLVFSSLRFLVFCLQFCLLFLAFTTVSFHVIFCLVAVLFLLTTLTPSLLFGKLVIRESIALLVFSEVIQNEIIILVVSLLLWVINLGIPSFFGGLILLIWKPKK